MYLHNDNKNIQSFFLIKIENSIAKQITTTKYFELQIFFKYFFIFDVLDQDIL